MSDNGSPSINFKLYTAEGVECLWHIPFNPTDLTNADLNAALGKSMLALVAALLAAGWSAALPGLTPGERREAVQAVMRRVSDKGVPIIDFYSPRNAKYAIASIWLDSDKPAHQNTAAFLAASGFKSLEDIPLYDGQGAYMRASAQANHEKARLVPRPFSIVTKPTGELTEKGNPKMRFDRFEAASGEQVNKPPAPPVEKEHKPHWWDAAIHDAALFKAYGKARDSVLRTLLADGKVAMDTPLAEVLALALEQAEDGDIAF